MQGKRSAMTLIELLISLAIIGIMTATAFPIFSYYQRRSSVDDDIENFVQLFNYARALQNNPDSLARKNGDYNYEILLSNNDGKSKAELRLHSDPGKIIDTANFSEEIQAGLGGGEINSNNANNLLVFIAGSPPKELISCAPKNCDLRLAVSLRSNGSNNYAKTATIINSHGDQPLTITVK